jgi:nicotinamidase-related amidase
MSSLPVRDQLSDHLITPKNAALLVIDYQPVQVDTVRSMDREVLADNIVRVAKTAKAFGLPIVLTTVNVKTGINKPMIQALKVLDLGMDPIDRTVINAWEDADFYAAVSAAKRKKLVMCALWTEVCLVFPALDALKEGYEVYPVVDAVGGTSTTAHLAGLERITQAGGQPTTWVQLACELQRDWGRSETVPQFKDIVFSYMHETVGA